MSARSSDAPVAEPTSAKMPVIDPSGQRTASTTPGTRSAFGAVTQRGPDAAANQAATPVAGAPVLGATVVGATVVAAAPRDPDPPEPRPRATATTMTRATAPRIPATRTHRGLRCRGG